MFLQLRTKLKSQLQYKITAFILVNFIQIYSSCMGCKWKNIQIILNQF